ncbi:predicted protein [Postia placenta Mad-698-R]|nr:predicted protein [Postia placenta Mad-698-R]
MSEGQHSSRNWHQGQNRERPAPASDRRPSKKQFRLRAPTPRAHVQIRVLSSCPTRPSLFCIHLVVLYEFDMVIYNYTWPTGASIWRYTRVIARLPVRESPGLHARTAPQESPPTQRLFLPTQRPLSCSASESWLTPGTTNSIQLVYLAVVLTASFPRANEDGGLMCPQQHISTEGRRHTASRLHRSGVDMSGLHQGAAILRLHMPIQASCAAAAHSTSAAPAPTPASATSTPTTVPRSRRTAAPALLLVDAPDDAAEVAEDAPDDAAEAAEDAPDAEAAEDAPDNAAEAADDALDNAAKVAEDTSAEAAEAVEDTLDDAAEAAEDAPDNVAGASEDAPDDAEAAEVALDDAAEVAENAPDNPAEAAENVPDDAVEAAGDVPDDAAETAEDTSDDALEAAEVAAEVAEAAPEEADAVHTSAAMHYERSDLWGIAARSEGRGAGGVEDGDKGVPAAHSADWRARAACCSAVVHLLARHSAAASWNAVDEHTQDMSVLAVAERGRGSSGERENALAGAAARGNGALEAGEDARVDAAGLGGGGAKEGGEDKRPDEHRVLFSRSGIIARPNGHVAGPTSTPTLLPAWGLGVPRAAKPPSRTLHIAYQAPKTSPTIAFFAPTSERPT